MKRLLPILVLVAALAQPAGAVPVVTLTEGVTVGGLPDRLCVYLKVTIPATDTGTWGNVQVRYRKPDDLRWLRITHPVRMQFRDESTGSPTAWLWSFGDGATSREQHPIHDYNQPGSYDVSLTATNASGSDTLTRPALVTVVSYAPPIGAGSTVVLSFGDLKPGSFGLAKIELQLPAGSKV